MDIENVGYFDEEEVKSSRQSYKHLSLKEKCQTYLYSEDGRTYKSIAEELDRDPRTISNLHKKARKKDTLENKHPTKGRYARGSSKLTDAHKKFILKWSEVGAHNSSQEVWIHLTSIKNLRRISYDTVNRYLKTLGSWVKPRLDTVISQDNLIKRKWYCEANRDTITTEDVLFTDESLFELNRVTVRMFKFKRAARPKMGNSPHGLGRWFGPAYS